MTLRQINAPAMAGMMQWIFCRENQNHVGIQVG